MNSPSDGYPVNVTLARLIRHAPRQGLEAAGIDVAQDLLLRHLHDVGLLSELAFKGGTALRKLYAGPLGRFSLDLDFSVAQIGTDAETVLALLADEVDDLTLGPFTYGLAERRGKRILLVRTDLAASTGQLTSKLDVSPPPWLEPVRRGWVPMPIHDAYGGPLPELSTVRLEENVAEKVARLNRTTTARDVYDLVWIWRHYRDGGGLDRDLVRRLAVLKIWVDAFGLHSRLGAHWKPGHEGCPFDPDVWLRTRPAAEFDREDIGELTVAAPDLDDLAADLVRGYEFLRDLEPSERQVARLDGSDRPLVLAMLATLPTARLPAGSCW